MEDCNEKKKVMVIDDDETILAITKIMLKNDYDVTTVNSGEEALEVFNEGFVPDLVLLDLDMPGLNGWETYAQLRGIDGLSEVPVSIYTTSDAPEDKARAKEMGAADFIRKPVKKAELLERAAKLIM